MYYHFLLKVINELANIFFNTNFHVLIKNFYKKNKPTITNLLILHIYGQQLTYNYSSLPIFVSL